MCGSRLLEEAVPAHPAHAVMLAPNAEELALPDCLDEVEAVQVSATLHPPRNLLVRPQARAVHSRTHTAL